MRGVAQLVTHHLTTVDNALTLHYPSSPPLEPFVHTPQCTSPCIQPGRMCAAGGDAHHAAVQRHNGKWRH